MLAYGMGNNNHDEALADVAATFHQQEDEFDRRLTELFLSERINRAEYMRAVFAMDRAAEVGGNLVH